MTSFKQLDGVRHYKICNFEGVKFVSCQQGFISNTGEAQTPRSTYAEEYDNKGRVTSLNVTSELMQTSIKFATSKEKVIVKYLENEQTILRYGLNPEQMKFNEFISRTKVGFNKKTKRPQEVFQTQRHPFDKTSEPLTVKRIYSDEGEVKSISSEQTKSYKYQSGLLSKVTLSTHFLGQTNLVSQQDFSNYEFDSCNNWISREINAVSNGEEQKTIETRKIEYYKKC